MEGALFDTSAWVAYLRKGGPSGIKRVMSAALEEGAVWTCWVVRTELLVGARDMEAFERLSMLLAALPDAEVGPGVWEAAAKLGFDLRRRGTTVPLPDLLVAAAALAADIEVWHVDEDFERIRAVAPLKTKTLR
ncbi:MAG: PIN domain-containing protein [Actinomycetota bacterium]